MNYPGIMSIIRRNKVRAQLMRPRLENLHEIIRVRNSWQIRKAHTISNLSIGEVVFKSAGDILRFLTDGVEMLGCG